MKGDKSMKTLEFEVREDDKHLNHPLDEEGKFFCQIFNKKALTTREVESLKIFGVNVRYVLPKSWYPSRLR
jgi:hypothetical protein